MSIDEPGMMTNTPRFRGGRARLAAMVLWYLAGSAVGAVVLAMGIAIFAADSNLVVRLQSTDAADRDWWKSQVPTGDRIDWRLRGRRRQTTFPGLEIVEYKAGAYSLETGQPETATATRVDAGWPFSCLTGSSWYLMPASSPPGSPIILEMNAFQFRTASGSRIVPWRPRPMGLLLDSIVMGLLVAIGPVGWLLARRIERRIRGRCPACGYPGVGARCSECGRVGQHSDPVQDDPDRPMLTREP